MRNDKYVRITERKEYSVLCLWGVVYQMWTQGCIIEAARATEGASAFQTLQSMLNEAKAIEMLPQAMQTTAGCWNLFFC